MIVILETNGCFADGVIAATQCHVGHRTLYIEDMGKTAAVFVDVALKHIIRVAPQLDIRQKAIHFFPGESSHYLAQLKAYQNIPDEEMFSVAPVVLNTPIETILSFPGHRVNCDQCGEEIINEREVLRNGHIFCQTCAGNGYYKPEGRAIHFPQAIKQDFGSLGISVIPAVYVTCPPKTDPG